LLEKNLKNNYDRFNTIELNLESQQSNINKLFKKTELNIKNKLLDTMVNIPGIVDTIKELPNLFATVEAVNDKLNLTASKLLEQEVTLDQT